MILRAVLLSLAQLSDPRFARVLRRGALLALGLLGTASAAALWALFTFLPETLTLPLIGPVAFLDEALGWAAVPLLLILSTILMVPVASAMTALFLDEVAAAVEARHYPGLPPVRPLPWSESLREAAGVAGLALGANLLALVLYVALAPLAPLIFIALNGWLLGREHFAAAALRRQGRDDARALVRRHRARVWAAGCLVAVPLLIPVVNLAVPTLAAATFTHLHRRLAG